jgi:nucleoside-diphosphate-sugar epimerase
VRSRPESEGGPILLTGATGFVGSHVARELRRLGARLVLFARSERKAEAWRGQGVEVRLGDLTDSNACARAIAGCASVLHLAAAADVSDPRVNQRVNVEGLENLLAACRSAGVRHLTFVSSTCAGRPKRDAYGETKLLGEDRVKASGLAFTIVRPTMIYGRGSKEFETFARAVRLLPVVPLIGNGKNVIQPVFIDDAVFVLAALAQATRPQAARGMTYDLAGPEPIAFNDFVQAVARALGRRRRPVVHLPPAPLLLAARALGRLATHVPLTVDQVLAFLQDTRVDLEPLRRHLGFVPRALDQGLPLALSAPEGSRGPA